MKWLERGVHWEDFMQFFHVHPADAQRLRAWLRSQVVCVVTIVCVLLAIRIVTSVPTTTLNRANAEQHAVAERVPGPIAVSPEGWRRTRRGWEHASTWQSIPLPIHEIVHHEQDREPAWITFTLEKLRSMPPLIFALIQVTAIAAIVNVVRDQEKSIARRPNS